MPLKSQIFTSNGTWTRPSGVTAVILQIIGPGAGGRGQAGAGFGTQGAGGSTGEFALNLFVPVTGATVAVVVGAGSAGVFGNLSPLPGVGSTTFGPTATALYANDSSYPYPSAPAGNGGGIRGSDAHGVPGLGTAESITYFGGCAGREGGNGAQVNGEYGASNADTAGGAPGPVYIAGVRNYPGTGGSAAVWPTAGIGGTGALVAGTPATNGGDAIGYGAGGGGAGDGESFGPGHTGGTGGDGAVIVYWTEP